MLGFSSSLKDTLLWGNVGLELVSHHTGTLANWLIPEMSEQIAVFYNHCILVQWLLASCRPCRSGIHQSLLWAFLHFKAWTSLKFVSWSTVFKGCKWAHVCTGASEAMNPLRLILSADLYMVYTAWKRVGYYKKKAEGCHSFFPILVHSLTKKDNNNWVWILMCNLESILLMKFDPKSPNIYTCNQDLKARCGSVDAWRWLCAVFVLGSEGFSNVEWIEQYPLRGEQTKVAIKGSPDRMSWKLRAPGAERVLPVSSAAAEQPYTFIEKQFSDRKMYFFFFLA